MDKAYASYFVSFLLSNFRDIGNIEKIILFGSVARNEAAKDSDIDLFVETDENLDVKISRIKEDFYNSIKTKKYWALFNVKNEINCSIGKLKDWKELERSIIFNGILLYGKYSGKIKTKPYYLFTISQTKDRNKNISLWRKLYGYKQKVNNKSYESKGLIHEYNGKKLSRATFMMPSRYSGSIIKILKENKIKYELIPLFTVSPKQKTK